MCLETEVILVASLLRPLDSLQRYSRCSVRLPRVESLPAGLVVTLTILETNSCCACKAIFRNRWENKAVSDQHKLRETSDNEGHRAESSFPERKG